MVMTEFDVPSSIQALEAALAAGESLRLRNVAHSFKGPLGYLLARPALEAARRLEAAAAAANEGEWSTDVRGRLVALTADLRVQLERVEANQRAVLAMT